MIVFIANPSAGRGAAAQATQEIRQAMDATGQAYEIRETTGPGQTAALARAVAVEGATTVAAVGGDGSVHEVANALLESGAAAKGIRLGIVPVGSGNDFARTLGVPADASEACKRLAGKSVRQVDVGHINELAGPDVLNLAESGHGYFVNGLGIGFTAAVVIEAMALKRLTGLPLYVSALLRAVILRHQTPLARIELDGQHTSTPVCFVEACNGQWEGGGFWTAPRAQLDDGQLQIVTVGGMGRLQLLGTVQHILKGTHADLPLVDITPARQLTIELAQPAPVQADGEILARAAQRISVEVVPSALPVAI